MEKSTTYCTGKPCIRGHVAPRWIASKQCTECVKEAKRANLHKKEYNRQYKLDNKAKINETTRLHRIKNHDRLLARRRAYKIKNADKITAANRAYREANKDKAGLSSKFRTLRIKQATPPWVNKKELEAIYVISRKIARFTGIKQHVDHIYPLKGKTSWGLHVPWNLRIVPSGLNHIKANKDPIGNETNVYEQVLRWWKQGCFIFKEGPVHVTPEERNFARIKPCSQPPGYS